jgi:bacteriorhodopsin
VFMTLDVAAPWEVDLGLGQRELIFYSLAFAGLALFAQFVYGWLSTAEISPRYRTASYASTCLCGVAFLSYLYLAVEFDLGYDLVDGRYVPNAKSVGSFLPRYADWSVTVPLLIVEGLAVSSLAGARARKSRFVGMACAFLMIFTGYLGAGVIGHGNDSSSMLLWGMVSTVFFAVLYVVLLGALRSSKGTMGDEAYASYRNAIILLVSVWGWYPIAYAIHNWTSGGTATTIIQVGFSFADVAAKIGFGVLIHKVAKLRTAEDVNEGVDVHPEDVWVSSVKHSEAVQPALKGLPTTAVESLVERFEERSGTPSSGVPRRASAPVSATDVPVATRPGTGDRSHQE